MSIRFHHVVAFGALLSLAAGLCLAAAADDTTVYRLTDTARGSFMGHPCLELILEPPMGGRTIQVAVPNKNPTGGYDPSAVVTDVIKEVGKGGLVRLHATISGGTSVVGSFGKYDLKPGEDAPHGFVFKSSAKKAVGKEEHLVLTVSKYGQEANITIPNVKNAAGTLAPEPGMAALVDKLKPDTVIEVDAEQSGAIVIAQAIDLYVPPVSGTFEKLADTTIDGKKRPALVVTIAGESQTLPLAGRVSSDGRWIPDTKLLAAIKTLKPGAAVVVSIRERAGQKIVRDIHPTPAETK